MELNEEHEAAFSPPGSEDDAVEQREVLKWSRDVERAREHDRPARAQYAIDRRYAAGTADRSWAVNTNLIGNYVDILVDYLYAKDPDVSCRPAEEVISSMPEEPLIPPQPPPAPGDPEADARFLQEAQAYEAEKARRAQEQFARRKARAERQDFAATLEIVISKLWRAGKLKKAARRQVRSSLSVGPGWLKCAYLIDTKTDPLVESQLNDLRDNLERIRAKQQELAEAIPEDTELAIRELEEQIESLEGQVEIILRKGLAIDFVSAENLTVSTDVEYLEDYLDAGWISNRIFVRKSELRAKFPRLTDDDVSAATNYFLRSPRDTISPKAPVDDQVVASGTEDATAADQYVSDKGGAATSSATDQQGEPFAAVTEIWDREANNVKTMIEGVKRWAREPYQPRYATTRFYPYFYLAFYEVDGARHPQSASGRLAKLQDEYAESRSKFRLARRRATPATLFNKSQVTPGNARDIEKAVEQEYVGIEPQNPNVPLDQLFAPKPVQIGDPILYDTSPIVRDMEKISGVQEAKQTSSTRRSNMTATEAAIEEQSFSERTNADRDAIDDMLTDLAEYTAEIALQALSYEEVQRMAGVDAFWPENLPIEDITTMVEVDIEAGSTGRPNAGEQQRAWATMLPLIRQDIIEIQQARAAGNESLAKALIALLQETLRRMGDRGDVERFLPDPVTPAMGAPGPGAIGAPGVSPAAPPDPGGAPEFPPQPDQVGAMQ